MGIATLYALLVLCALIGAGAFSLSRWADADPGGRIPGNGLFGAERRTAERIEGSRMHHGETQADTTTDVAPALESSTLTRDGEALTCKACGLETPARYLKAETCLTCRAPETETDLARIEATTRAEAEATTRAEAEAPSRA